MGVVIRQSIKSSIVSYSGFLLGAINTLLLFPSITQPNEFGLTRVILSIAFILAQFSEFGTGNMQSRYLAYIVERHGSSRSMYVWYFRRVVFVFLFFIGLCYLFRNEIIDQFKDRSDLVESFFFLVFPMAGSLLIFNVLDAYARTQLRIVIPTILREVYIRLFILISLGLLYLGVVDFDGFMGLFVLAYISAFCILGLYVLFLDKGVSIPKKDYVEYQVFKEMLFYGFITIFGTTVWRLVNELDALMIGMLADLNGVAVYATAFYFVTLIQLPQRYLHQITIPILANALNKDDRGEIHNLYKKVSLNEFLIGLLLFLLLWFNLDLVYHYMPPIYSTGASVVFTIGMLRLFDMSTGLNADIIIYSRHFRYTMFTGAFLLIISIATNYWLIPKLGLLGAAIATALSIFTFNVINLGLTYWKYRMHPFSRGMLIAILVATSIFALLWFLPMPENVWLQSIIRSAIIVAVYPLAVIGLKLSPDIDNLVKQALLKLNGHKD